ncbi:hypothetical protein N7468_002043 [Penicillium chermesinum]|uniref:Uncharacterized protein n=1 Tax=Penicillium chermesinum TaxID=63820 RepID=A0A9W9TX81_9EURO|nr:uncharacterized protein N7468_002043 [Penicillium chermesinum]KAJ5247060.1 hypothetical protein N7468_002043 [Penicillium chermesinum]KAJ6145308.1 hypothetical protein N7470_009203 [Penicillium chermesinum]
MTNSYDSSDLNSVLQTLSGLARQNGSQTPIVKASEPCSKVQTRPESHYTPQTRNNISSNPPGVDPSTITSWPAALRYVMRTVGQNEETQRHIRGLITSQHTHELKWWKGREVLVEKQLSRGQKQKELAECLRLIGAPVDKTEVQSAQELQAELANYDLKIYRAVETMADAMTRELKALKIPFFVINRNLIDDATLSKAELRSLQLRMLQLLEDLCKE